MRRNAQSAAAVAVAAGRRSSVGLVGGPWRGGGGGGGLGVWDWRVRERSIFDFSEKTCSHGLRGRHNRQFISRRLFHFDQMGQWELLI